MRTFTECVDFFDRQREMVKRLPLVGLAFGSPGCCVAEGSVTGETTVMSHAVAPTDLFETAKPYGCTPFLLYVGASGTARVNHVSVELAEGSDRATITGFGRGVPPMLTPGFTLSLLWPPHEQGGFSLIADGTGSMEAPDLGADQHLVLTVTDAVLHRPAPVDGPASC